MEVISRATLSRRGNWGTNVENSWANLPITFSEATALVEPLWNLGGILVQPWQNLGGTFCQPKTDLPQRTIESPKAIRPRNLYYGWRPQSYCCWEKHHPDPRDKVSVAMAMTVNEWVAWTVYRYKKYDWKPFFLSEPRQIATKKLGKWPWYKGCLMILAKKIQKQTSFLIQGSPCSKRLLFNGFFFKKMLFQVNPIRVTVFVTTVTPDGPYET